MHGENGIPHTPDWLPESPRCNNPECGCRETYCKFLADNVQASCCGQCSHGLNPLPMPALYDGDQA